LLNIVSSYVTNHNLPLVGLVNNAGVARYSPFESENLDTLKRHFERNFFGTIYLTQKFLPLIRRDKGRVIVVSSVAGCTVTSGAIAFATSKHALEAAVDALRLEMEEFQVSVSIVEPGMTNTTLSQLMVEMNPTKLGIAKEQAETYKNFWDWLHNLETVHSDTDYTSVITSAIVHALTDPYPKAKYPVGQIGGIPVPFSIFADSVLTDTVVDRLRMS